MEKEILTQLQNTFNQLQELSGSIGNDIDESVIEIIEEKVEEALATAVEEALAAAPEEALSAAPEEKNPITFLEKNCLRVADLPFTIDESKKADKSASVAITSVPVALLDLKPTEIMTTAASIVSSLIETQHPVLPGEAIRMNNKMSYASVYRKSVSEVLFTWISYPTATEIAAVSQAPPEGKTPPYAVLIEKGIQVSSLIFKCTKSDGKTLTFEFNSESVEGWSDDVSSAVTNMVGQFLNSNTRKQGGQLVGKKAYMSLTRISDNEVLFTWITYPRAVSSEIVTTN